MADLPEPSEASLLAAWNPATTGEWELSAMEKAILPVSKFDAARRQLETAIRLYFSQGDPVSIHTLASAAAQILQDLSKHRGGDPMLFREAFVQHFRPEQQPEVKKTLAAAENFFKHAHRDPETVLRFRIGQTELVLLEAGEAYHRLTSERVPLLVVYWVWFMIEAGKELVVPAEVEALRRKSRQSFTTTSRQAFFSDVLPIAASLGTEP